MSPNLRSTQPKLKKLFWKFMILMVLVCSLFLGDYAINRAKSQGWTTYTRKDGLASNDIDTVAIADDNTVWVGTYRGLSHFDGEAWTTYTDEDGLVCNDVTTIAFGKDGTVWVGSYDGLSHFDGEAWTTYTEEDGLVGNGVTTIAFGKDGTVWVGSNQGLSHFNGEIWTSYTKANGLVENYVVSIAIANDGTIWVANIEASSASGGISHYDGETWVTYTPADEEAWDDRHFNYVDNIAVSNDGDVWIDGLGSVSRFNGETWTVYTSADSLALSDNPYHISIAVTPGGDVWVGSYGGISHFNGDHWQSFAVDGYYPPAIIGIVPDGKVWVGINHDPHSIYGYRAISRFDGETWSKFRRWNSGLPGDVNVLTFDAQGRVWFGSSEDGLSVFDESASLPAQQINTLLDIWSILRFVIAIAILFLLVLWNFGRIRIGFRRLMTLAQRTKTYLIHAKQNAGEKRNIRRSISVGLLHFFVGPIYAYYFVSHLGWGEMSWLGGVVIFGISLGLILGVLAGGNSYINRGSNAKKGKRPIGLLIGKWTLSYAVGMSVAWFGTDIVVYLNNVYYLWAQENEIRSNWDLHFYGIVFMLLLGVIAGVVVFRALTKAIELHQRTNNPSS